MTRLLLLSLLLTWPAGERAQEDPHLPFTEQLDGDGYVTLRWGFSELNGTITFQLTVDTTGWVGFGLSPNGNMIKADIVTGGVGPNGNYFTDRHGIGKFLPPADGEQSYTLLSLSEVEGQTTMTFWRSIDTCDEDDFRIAERPIKLIYAYGTTDEIKYHSTRRGTKEVNLLRYMPKASVPDSKYLDLTVENITVPPVHTYYHCKVIQIPRLNGKHHVYRIEPIIDHLDLVHHMLLYGCSSSVNEAYEEACYQRANEECNSAIHGWAVGGGSFELPENAGIAIGGKKHSTFYRLEMHYNNPTKEAGSASPSLVSSSGWLMFWQDTVYLRSRRDNSGLRLYYTNQLREHEVGTLTTGLQVDPYGGYVIPPKATGFHTYGLCNTSHFSELQDGPVPDLHVFSILLHTHLAGRMVRVGLFRDGEQLDFLGLDENYDFEFQRAVNLGSIKTIKPGDEILVECTYNTVNRTGVTKGGLGTPDEMCLAFIFYYPAINISDCVSHPNMSYLVHNQETTLQQLVDELMTKNWTSEAIAEHEDMMKKIPQKEVHSDVFNNYNYYDGKIRDMMKTPTVDCTRVPASTMPNISQHVTNMSPTQTTNVSDRGSSSWVVTSGCLLLLLCMAGL